MIVGLQFVHVLLCSPSERLSTRLDNEVYINLKLSISFDLYGIFINIVIFIYFYNFFSNLHRKGNSVFSPKHSN